MLQHHGCRSPPSLVQKTNTLIPPAMASTMKAVNYNGPFKVKVQEVEMPKIQHPDDVILKVTTVCQPLTNSARSCSRIY